MTAAEQLADARRKLGLSLDDISSRTKISVERLSAIERADPAELPSFVYLQGFVRAYAAEVQLDPDALVDEYIFELSDPVALTSLEDSVVLTPTLADALAEFESEDDRADLIPPQPNSSTVAFVPPGERPMRAADREPLDAAAPPVVGASHAPPAPPATHRTSLPLVPRIVATMLAFVGGYLLNANIDRASVRHTVDSDSVRASGPSRGPDPVSSAKPATNQQPSVSGTMDTDKPSAQPVTPAPDTRLPHRPKGVRRQTPAAPSDRGHTSISNETGRPSAERQSDRAVARGAAGNPPLESTTPPTAQDPAPTTTAGTPEKVDTVSGAWNVTSKVESATLAAYEDLMLGFRLELAQRGNQVVGEGRKVSENGAALPARRRTPIKVEGTLEGNRLALDFTETGSRRKSAGRFVLYLAEDGSFRGRFTSDAAQSSGVTIAVRESSSGRH